MMTADERAPRHLVYEGGRADDSSAHAPPPTFGFGALSYRVTVGAVALGMSVLLILPVALLGWEFSPGIGAVQAMIAGFIIIGAESVYPEVLSDFTRALAGGREGFPPRDAGLAPRTRHPGALASNGQVLVGRRARRFQLADSGLVEIDYQISKGAIDGWESTLRGQHPLHDDRGRAGACLR